MLGMITEYHRYTLVNLDASLLNLSHFKNINKNITWFSLQNIISVNHQKVSQSVFLNKFFLPSKETKKKKTIHNVNFT